MSYTEKDIDILGRTIYGEARGEYTKLNGGLPALISIANVVINRHRQQKWYGKTIQEVCLKPFQFSCWNEDDPNRSVILTANASRNRVFRVCLEVAEKTLAGNWPDLTRGSDHYYAIWLPVCPSWALGKEPVARFGCHVFFNLGGRK